LINRDSVALKFYGYPKKDSQKILSDITML
jgi:hypothetical protein